MILVKLAIAGRSVTEFEMSDNPTVENLLRKAQITYTTGCVTRNHESLSRESRLYNGDMVCWATPTKGNQIFEVKVIIAGSSTPIVSLPAEEGMTVNAVLAQLNSETKSKIFINNDPNTPAYEYRDINGDIITGNTVLSRPASGTVRISLTTRTKGNE
jgi:sulfur carrier protein ThiS